MKISISGISLNYRVRVAGKFLVDVGARGVKALLIAPPQIHGCYVAPENISLQSLTIRISNIRAAQSESVQSCVTCINNRGQDWPEYYTHIYAQFPHRRAELIFCAASREVTHPALDRRKGSMSHCPSWQHKFDIHQPSASAGKAYKFDAGMFNERVIKDIMLSEKFSE